MALSLVTDDRIPGAGRARQCHPDRRGVGRRPLVHPSRDQVGWAAAGAPVTLHFLSAHLPPGSNQRGTLTAAVLIHVPARPRLAGFIPATSWLLPRTATSFMNGPPRRWPSGRRPTTSSQGVICVRAARGWQWIAVDDSGSSRTFRELQRPAPGAPSRGNLIPDYLRNPAAAGRYLQSSSQRPPSTRASICFWPMENPCGTHPTAPIDSHDRFPPGIYGLVQRSSWIRRGQQHSKRVRRASTPC